MFSDRKALKCFGIKNFVAFVAGIFKVDTLDCLIFNSIGTRNK